MILPYLLKSTLCLGILFSFYKVALEHKAMHQFKRYYLLASLIFAFTIPLITFTYTVDAIPEPAQLVNTSTYYSNTAISQVPLQETAEKSLLPIVLWSLYVSGILIFGTRFVINLVRLKRKINASEQFPKDEFTLSLLGKSVVPHSFLKWIFLNKAAYLNQKIAPEVLAHEATHVRQKHSWDILFIELLQIFFWFNPLIWLSQKSIKLNHEFLADQGAIDNKSNIAIYQNILLSYASSTHHTALESPFNYSLTKKRILMLSQTFSRKRAALSALLLLPIIGLCLFLFNNEIKAQPESRQSLATTERPITARNVTIVITSTNNFVVNGKNATKATIKKTLDIFNQDLTKEERDRVINFHVTAERTITPIDLRFLQKVASEYGYHRILANEKEEIIRSKNNHPAYNHPTKQDLQNWEDKNYRLFLDDVEIPNHDIKNYHPDDLPYYYSLEIENGATEVYIWTNPFWQEENNIGLTTMFNQKSDYALEFIEGAQRNGNKPLLIEIRNNTITINGKPSTLDTFQKDIDAATRDWEETDYTDPVRSYIFKGNSPSFLNKLEQEYAKTHISKATGGSTLVPPAPPAPLAPNDVQAPPPPPSVEDHLFKMNRLGGEFYYNTEKITYQKAQQLVKSNSDLNVKTPYPYSTSPKTYISVEPSTANSAQLQKPSASRLKMKEEYLAKMKKIGGSFFYNRNEITYKKALEYVRTDGRLFVVTPIGNTRTYLSLEPLKNITVRSISGENGWPKKLKATPEEIKTYNRLAKKYNANPNGIIKQAEVARMYDIYSRMTAKQKKAAQTYPVLPPPPPPPPTKKKTVSKTNG